MRHFFTLPLNVRIYIVAVLLFGAATLSYSFHDLLINQLSTRWLVLAVLILLTGSFLVKVPGVNAYLSVSEMFVFASVLTVMVLVATAKTTAETIAAARAGGVPVPSVVVRWCPQGRHTAEAGPVQSLVGRMIGQAGIDLSWAGCTDRDADALQRGPFAVTESVAVRLVATAPVSLSDDHPALGESLIERAHGILATVYVDRVDRLARNARVDPATLLARAIAHEIGHLLLGTTRHSARGLMRARWSVAELRRDAFGDWVFSAQEAQGMRAGARRRAVRERLLALGAAPEP